MPGNLSQRAIIIGVMGGANVTEQEREKAYILGKMIAENGWVLLNGGRNCGIMEASAKGAWEHGGLTVGILPDDTLENLSDFIKIPIVTGMGSARNNINVLSSSIVVACSGGMGTVSEIALALKQEKRVILMGISVAPLFSAYSRRGYLVYVDEPQQVVKQIKKFLNAGTLS